jgi:phosphoserine phosphatase
MTVMAVEELCVLLDERLAAHDGPRPVLASDADGTLWRGDVGETLFVAALREQWLREPARAALAAEAKRFGVPAEGDANAIAGALYQAWRAGVYPDEPAFAMMAWCFAGHTPDEMSALAARVLDDFDPKAQARPAMTAVMAWALERGLPFYVVSASPVAAVVEAIGRLGSSADWVVAMEPVVAGGVLGTRLGTRATYAEGKLARLRERTAAPLLAAFGDGYYDAEMLAASMVPVAVCPTPRLRERCAAIAGVVTIEES